MNMSSGPTIRMPGTTDPGRIGLAEFAGEAGPLEEGEYEGVGC